MFCGWREGTDSSAFSPSYDIEELHDDEDYMDLPVEHFLNNILKSRISKKKKSEAVRVRVINNSELEMTIFEQCVNPSFLCLRQTMLTLIVVESFCFLNLNRFNWGWKPLMIVSTIKL